MPPIYEFECQRCWTVTEVERKISERKQPCPCGECGSLETVQIISRSDFRLVGDWASVGYGGNVKKNGRKA
jgi:putative FmdB family regulatory protein